ncbi:MAG TPA: metallopeptidase family protein [Actinomycetota bacterium]|jgi:predicted Zn-dependent protease with MMP-like domain|nr:metallopeptidase family protein [Actinomycetota bacterium]
MRQTLSSSVFEKLVDQAIEELPEELFARIANLEITIEDRPPESAEDARLLGLYEGIPLTERGSDYFGVLPDRITLFKVNIEQEAETPEEVQEVVRVTVLHEIAHHFGIDDDRLEELGWD